MSKPGKERKAIGKVLNGVRPGMFITTTIACAHPSNVPYPPGEVYQVLSMRQVGGGNSRVKGIEIAGLPELALARLNPRKPRVRSHWIDRHTFWKYGFVVVDENPLRRAAQLSRIMEQSQK